MLRVIMFPKEDAPNLIRLGSGSLSDVTQGRNLRGRVTENPEIMSVSFIVSNETWHDSVIQSSLDFVTNENSVCHEVEIQFLGEFKIIIIKIIELSL